MKQNPRFSILPLLLLGGAALPAALLLLEQPAHAVELTGQLRGQVTDADGLAVPGATVTISSPQMQGTMTGQTDADGWYRFVALPPGQYRIEVTRQGFAGSVGAARVSAGATFTVNLTLQSQAGEVMVVTGDRPTVDVTSAGSGTTLTKEMLNGIPNATRSYQGSMNLAPGVSDNGTGNPNMRGGLSYGNQYYLDGVNTTDPLTNTFSTNMNFLAVEEVEILTGGMDAEYGRSLGGAVNVITSSGGNEFEGDFEILYNHSALQLYKPLPDEDPNEKPQNSTIDVTAGLGGPIVRDRIWFYTTVQAVSTQTTFTVPEEVDRPEPMQTELWRSLFLFGKLTFRPSAKHRIWIQGQMDPADIQNASEDIYTLPDAEIRWKQGGWLASLGHQWTPTDAIVVESQVYAQNSYLNYFPKQWDDCKNFADDGYCLDFEDTDAWFAYDPDGFASGPHQYASYTDRNRYSLNSKATFFFSLAGEHQARIGVQTELLTSYTILPGYDRGTEYWTYTTTPDDIANYEPALLELYDTNQEATFKGQLVSWYVQDVYNPVPRLTIRPGLRFDYGNFLDDLGGSVYDTLTVSPRFGVAFDATGDGRTRIHTYYGRFYDTGFLELPSILAKGLGGYSVYQWDDRTEDWSDTPLGTYADQFLVHEDLKTPYSDEFDLGVERDFGEGWALGATVTYEETHNLWEDDEINLIWNEEGTEVIGSRDGTGATYFRLRTPDEAYTQYTSLEFQANKEFTERWGMLASYTWSRAVGMYRDDISQGLASYSFDIPTQIKYERGLLGYDTPHNLKIAGSYTHPDAWQLAERTALGYLFGWSFEMTSGYPYRPVYYTPAYGVWATYHESLELGGYQLPLYQRADLKAGLTLAQGETTWDLTVEVYNAFNNRTVSSVQTAYDEPDGSVSLDEDGDVNFGQPEVYQSPRYIQFGLRGSF